MWENVLAGLRAAPLTTIRPAAGRVTTPPSPTPKRAGWAGNLLGGLAGAAGGMMGRAAFGFEPGAHAQWMESRRREALLPYEQQAVTTRSAYYDALWNEKDWVVNDWLPRWKAAGTEAEKKQLALEYNYRLGKQIAKVSGDDLYERLGDLNYGLSLLDKDDPNRAWYRQQIGEIQKQIDAEMPVLIDPNNLGTGPGVTSPSPPPPSGPTTVAAKPPAAVPKAGVTAAPGKLPAPNEMTDQFARQILVAVTPYLPQALKTKLRTASRGIGFTTTWKELLYDADIYPHVLKNLGRITAAQKK
ncbi:MAG: hypothetical protein AMJ75_00245 [Phycisphaerae bacterium SM1_79]|nr:MAG: hypothetical protein AMJ75_00245 [Phycisphaerae bacterium SM1_79]